MHLANPYLCRMACIAVLLAAVSSQAANPRTITPEEFGRFFARAMEKVNEEDRVRLKNGGYTPISDVSFPESNASGGAIAFVVQQHANAGGGSVRIRGGQALFQNYNSSALYGLRMPLPAQLSAAWVPDLFERGGIKKINKLLDGWYDGVQGTLSYEDGYLLIAATYAYEGDDYDVSDTFKDLMMLSRNLIEEVTKATWDLREKHWKAVKDQPVTSLDAAQMYSVFEADLSDYGGAHESATVGRFQWWHEGERDMEIICNSDELILTQRFVMSSPTVMGPDAANQVNEMLAKEKDRRLPGADPTEVVFNPDDATLAVRSVYDLSTGAYTGNDLRKAYETFNGKFSKKLAEDVYGLMYRASDVSWESVADQSPKYLSREDLLYAAPWDISESEGEKEEAIEGFWEWSEGDTSVEVWNTGKVVTVGFWRHLPDDLSSDQRDEIIAAVNDHLQSDDIIHAGTPKASLYPGYDEILWVAVELPIGSYTYQQIQDVLGAFTDDYCQEADAAVGAVIDM